MGEILSIIPNWRQVLTKLTTNFCLPTKNMPQIAKNVVSLHPNLGNSPPTSHFTTLIVAKTIFKTDKKESFKTSIRRIAFNFFPAYRRMGGRICFLSDDWKEIHIKLGLNWTTKNYVGTVFGGSIYGALDPIYMVQLINILGREYVVWDKSASIKFIKPITKTVFAKFLIINEILTDIIEKIKLENTYTVNLSAVFEDENKVVYAEVSKQIYIANKNYYIAQKTK